MYAIGVDIGGTKCVVTLGKKVEDQLFIIHKGEKYETNQYSPAEMIAQLCHDINQYKEDVAGEIILGVGISCGGPLDSERGIILSPPNLPGWDEIDICERIAQQTGLKAWLMNDANACALAEWQFGAGQQSQHMAFLTFGTGLGAGLILNGQLYQGKSDMAGEVGHIRLRQEGPVGYGKIGSFEGFCSGGGLSQLAYMMILEAKQQGKETCLSLEATSAYDIALAAKQGDVIALSIFTKTGQYLGEGLSILLDILNLEKVILGGIYMRCEAWIFPEAWRVIEKETCLRTQACQILPSQLGESIGDYAALSIPFYQRRSYE